MQELSLDTQIKLALNELYDKRRLCAFLFAVIALGVLGIGFNWPKTYQSSTTLIRDQAQFVRPLLEGTAVDNSGSQSAYLAKEVIYSSRNLLKLIQRAGLNVKADGTQMDERELQVLKTELREKILIDRGGGDLLKISFTSRKPQKAFMVVSIASELFIEETAQKNRANSDVAFQFIDSQVSEYREKLDEINRRINEFKTDNVEVQTDAMQNVGTRIGDIKERIRRTLLELSEAKIQMDSLQTQLVAESQKTTVQEVVNAKQNRLAELESDLSSLRLSYTETYPDIVQLKEQIRSLRKAIADDETGRSIDNPKAVGGTMQVRSELYQRLSRQIADQELLIRTLEARKLDQEQRLNQVIDGSADVNKVVSKLEEMQRDREVTKQLHDRLLEKRENARVSMSLERGTAGALFMVQEPPIVPLVPKGLRFMHFVVLGLFLGFCMPIGAVIAWLVLDPSIRHPDSLEMEDEIPVFGSIGTFYTPREKWFQKFATAQAILLFVLSLIAVVSLSLSRFYQIL